MRAQVDYVIEGGVSGILAFGSNGEFYMVEENEMERGLKSWSIRQPDGFPSTSVSVPSVLKSAAVLLKWQSKTVPQQSAYFSLCFKTHLHGIILSFQNHC